MMIRIFAALGAGTLLLAVTTPAASAPHELVAARAAMSAMSVPFVPNAGQWDREAVFAAQTFAGTVFVTGEGRLVYRLAGKPVADGESGSVLMPERHRRAPALTAGWVLTETPVDASQSPLRNAPSGAGLQVGKVSYAIGNDERKYLDRLPAYERIDLGEVYPGIDVQVRATGSNIEKIFTVAPLGDPGRILIRLDGARRLELGSRGELIAHTGEGSVTYTAPVAYQIAESGSRVPVPVRYALDTTTGSYGFRVGDYDSGRPLVIDPLLQSTYLGGNSEDVATAMAVHPTTGDVYVAGYTQSTNFPKVVGGQQSVKASNYDVFVTRLDAALSTRLQSTYIGGGGDDEPTTLVIHPGTGEVYVAGYTYSTDFPATASGAQSAHSSDGSLADAFITRLNAPLTTRLQSTYYGGNSLDVAVALGIHPITGEVYIAGYSASTDLPGTVGSEQTGNATVGPGYDAFVARFNAALTSLLRATYLGGASHDYAWALAIHPASGDVYVAGTTLSDNFPKVAGAEQTVRVGGYDIFVTRLNATLSTRHQSTYFGGDGEDVVAALAVHPLSGDIYLAGDTYSFDLPKVEGAEQAIRSAGNDAFVSRLNAALTSIQQTTYLGGDGEDKAYALGINPANGDIYVAGKTKSLNFPKVALGAQAVHASDLGQHDAFVARLNPALTAIVQSTFVGGDGEDIALALAIHPSTSTLYVAGYTVSTNFPGVAGSEQVTKDTGKDAFVSRLSLNLLVNGAVPNPFNFPSKFNVPMGSLQTSAPAQITGLTVTVPIAISGGNFAQYCISTSACLCDTLAFTNVGATIDNGKFVCVRQFAPFSTPDVAKTTLVAGGTSANFVVTTGTEFGGGGSGNCTLDVDGNSSVEALTDGLLILRAMFGLTGTSVTNGAVGSGATRGTWALLQPYLNNNCGTSFAP